MKARIHQHIDGRYFGENLLIEEDQNIDNAKKLSVECDQFSWI